MAISKRNIHIIITALFLAYAAAFIWRSSFDVFGERYFSLFDDAMISMRYAHNLADGHGLVWNPGERVEGVTNPLWAAYMALVHKLPVPASKISLIIQITGAFLLALNLWMVRKIATAISGEKSLATVLAVLFTAFYYPLIYWSVMGMEVGLLLVLMGFVVWKLLEAMESERFPWLVYLILGFATLVRIDIAVPLLAVTLFFAYGDKQDRMRHIFWGAAMIAVFIGGQTLVRYLYYGELFPNTYYLKMVGYPMHLRIMRGLTVFLHFIWRSNIIFIAFPFIALSGSWTRKQRLLVWLIASQASYAIYVGGDSWEHWGGSNRFVSIVMPLFFVLFAHALVNVAKSVRELTISSKTAPPAARSLARHVLPVAVVLSLLQFNGHALDELFLLVQPNQVTLNKELAQRAEIIKEFTTEDATLGVTLAGVMPYFAERPGIDMLGKCDSFIAHQDSKLPTGIWDFMQFVPGHTKWDMDHTFGEKKPDVITHAWGGGRDKSGEYLRQHYNFLNIAAADSDTTNYQFWFRADSARILWDKVPGFDSKNSK